MNEWNIQSRAHACQACGKGFADKEVYYTLLMQNKHELQRHDVCKECSDKERAKPKDESKAIVSQWHGIYHRPPAAPPDAIQKETAETLLRKLIEANDPKHGPACFILAVMLERKRLLKVKEQFKREGTRVFVYEHPKTGDVFTITDPNLQLNQLDAVQRDVGDLLAHGLPETAPTPVAEVNPTPTSEPSAGPAPEAVPAEQTPAVEGPESQPQSEVLPEPAAPVEEILPASTPATEPAKAAEPAVGATEPSGSAPPETQVEEPSSSHEPGV